MIDPDAVYRVATVRDLQLALATLPDDTPIQGAYDTGFGKGAVDVFAEGGHLVLHVLHGDDEPAGYDLPHLATVRDGGSAMLRHHSHCFAEGHEWCDVLAALDPELDPPWLAHPPGHYLVTRINRSVHVEPVRVGADPAAAS